MRVPLLTIAATMLACAPVSAEVVRQQDVKAAPAPSQYFTGTVTLKPLAKPQPPGQASIGLVTFSPGARSHWHTHPAGQMLVVTEGCGWTQEEGAPAKRICKGDVVTVAPGVKHWHGASADTAMAQLAVTETLDGRNVDWMEPVSDAQYRAAASTE